VAAAEISRNAGSQFCPRVVAALEVCLGSPARAVEQPARRRSATPALGVS
jgi:HD-GYP domain-containing protein (c-di-GMP phosphodiesterase class II)